MVGSESWVVVSKSSCLNLRSRSVRAEGSSRYGCSVRRFEASSDRSESSIANRVSKTVLFFICSFIPCGVSVVEWFLLLFKHLAIPSFLIFKSVSCTPSIIACSLPPLFYTRCLLLAPSFPPLPRTHTATPISVVAPTHSRIHSFTHLDRSQYFFALKSSNPLVKSQKRRRKANQKSTGSLIPIYHLPSSAACTPKPRLKQPSAPN